MTIQQAILRLLANNEAWAGLIGTRTYPVQAPQGAPRPYATYRQIAVEKNHHMGGDSGLDMPGFQLSIVADTYATAQAAARAAETALNDFDSGTVEAGAEALHIQRIHLADESDLSQQPVAAQGLAAYEIEQDYDISYQREG